MGTEIERLELQLRGSFEGPSWHGPSLSEVLADVSAETASARPIKNAHTIWEIVLHLIATYNLVLKRMHGNPTPLTPEEDWPVASAATHSAWQDTFRRLRELNEQLCREIKEFDHTRLDDSFAGEPYSAYVQVIGIPQHNLYHAGQMMLLKRAASA
jgi:uncharacterized damage-inducible protein DinB